MPSDGPCPAPSPPKYGLSLLLRGLVLLLGIGAIVWLRQAGFVVWGLIISAVLFAGVWGLWVRMKRRGWLAGLAVWVVGAPLAIWGPFVGFSFAQGQGIERVGYVVFSATVTGGAVAWYFATTYPLQIIGAGIGALILLRLVGAMSPARDAAKDTV